MEKISWTDRVRNEEVLHTVNKKRNVPHTIKIRKANWIGHFLRRNCLLRHIIEGKIEGGIEVSRRGRRRRKHPVDNRKGKQRIPELERRRTRSHSVDNSL
jgi:hypothetical protein